MTRPASVRVDREPALVANARLQRLRRLAVWLDSAFRVPGTNFRFGLDPILGLIPGIGDAAGAIMGGAILLEAVRCGASAPTVARMLGNIALDAVVGAVPGIGDLFDAAWKSNIRNLALLERTVADPAKARRTDRRLVLLIGLAGLVLVTVVVVGGALLAVRLVQMVLGGGA